MLDAPTLSLIQGFLGGYVHHWVYTEHARPVMVVARYDHRGDKTYRQFAIVDGVWTEGVTTTPYPLFGLTSLSCRSPFNAILICEGEKCANLLQQLGWPSLSTVLGAQSVSKTDFSPLRHFEQFMILRDNDKAGLVYAREVSTAIGKVRTNAKIFVCNLTPDIPGGDVVDWVTERPLYGLQWDGFAPLDSSHRLRVAEALQSAIQAIAIPIEECPQVCFKADSTLFDGDPRPIEGKLRPVPPFPIDILPQRIADYLSLFARQMCIPVDFPATTFLALIGGLIGRSIRLTMRPGHHWEEAANVWAVLVGTPSAKKSPTLRGLCRFLQPIEESAKKEFAGAVQEFKRLKKRAEATKTEYEGVEPSLRRILTDDCTIPKLRELLAHNPRGLILRSDEIKGQLEKFDREGNEGDRSFLMQCWAGLDFYNEDRIARGSCLQIPLTVTWIGLTQPASLSQYLRQAIGETKGADGLVQRFQMVTFPDFGKKYIPHYEPMPKEWEISISELFITIEGQSKDNSKHLSFSETAQAHFNQWESALQNDCRGNAYPPHWESHLGKQPKLIAALSIILHVIVEATENTSHDRIELTTLLAAERLVNYYLEHAHRCYDSMESVEVSDARKVLDFVKQKKLLPRFKPSDIYRYNMGGIRESQRVTNALRLLQDLKCVAQEKVYGATGKPSEWWVVHPNLLERD